MKKPTPQKPKKKSQESDLVDKLGKLGSLGKKTDKSSQKKLPKKNKSHQGVVLIGGLHDVQRFQAIWVIMVIFFAILFGRAWWLQVHHADFYIQKANEFITFRQNLPVQRGMILDTNGVPLAANAPLMTVVFSPYDYANAYYTNKRFLQEAQSESAKKRYSQALQNMDLTRLASVSNIPKQTLQAMVKIDDKVNVKKEEEIKAALPKGTGSRRVVVFNKTTPEIAQTVIDLKMAGISVEKHEQRFYLQPEPNAHILGYMSQITKGKKSVYTGRSGLELTHNEYLSGKAGQMLMLRGFGTQIEEVKEIKPRTDGENLTLTIDSRLQYILYKELVELARIQSVRSASGMVVDVLTGDVLAMSSWPSYNSNNLSELNGTNERNRPVMDAIEPGSVMKPFTVAAALDSGKYNLNTLIHTSPGTLSVGDGRVIRDSANYGSITMAKLIQKSSNVGSAKIALSLPADAIAKIQTRFGFGQKTNLNMAGEVAGVVRTPKRGETALRATMAYGYGQEVTLAQIAQAYATLGNNGVMRPLRLIKDDPAPQSKRVISESHAQSIVAMMRTVTEQGGTALGAAINGYHVAGKTGTSRRIDPVKGGYAEGQYRNIFAGVAPASNPRFAVVIVAEDPQKQKYAGQTVAPVFAKVMKEVLRLYNVPFDKPLDVAQK